MPGAATLLGLLVGAACERMTPDPETVPPADHMDDSVVAGRFDFGGRAFTLLLDTLEAQGEITIVGLRAVAEDGSVHLDMQFDTPAIGRHGFESRLEVHANRLIGERDTALIVWFEEMPAAPLTGSSMQVFALSEGRLQPLWRPLLLDGEIRPLEGDGYDSRLAAGDSYPVMLRRGHYALVVPLVIDLDCERTAPCVRLPDGTAPGPARYAVEAEPHPPERTTTIVLYDLPHGVPMAERTVTPSSVVRILEASASITIRDDGTRTVISVDDDWLHVSIDGVPGWIFGAGMFEAVGLKSAA